MRLATLDFDRLIAEHPLAITESGLEELRLHVTARLAMFNVQPSATVEALLTQAAERATAKGKSQGGTGVIPIRGTISQHAAGDLSSMLAGGTATDQVAEQLRAFLADDAVSKIVLDIDSPGGSSYGVTELANEIYRARGSKPIIALANSLAASAAYWIGSAADQFFVTPGGVVGSVGVYAMHQEVSKMADNLGVKTTFIKAGKYKTLGNQFEPLSDEAIARVQQRVDDVYEQFLHDVAQGRGVSLETVRNGFGEGDVMTAKRAKAEGMVDGIATFEQVLARPFRNVTRSSGTKAEGEELTVEDQPEDEKAPADDDGANQEAEERRARMRRLAFSAKAAAGAA